MALRSVSDNFVRLNMKAKRFSRGKGRLSGSAYKRKEWRKNQGGGGGEGGGGRGGGGGRNVCFRCGKPGHWAKNCTEKGGFKNLGRFGGEEVRFDEAVGMSEEQLDEATLKTLAQDSPFPSIEEAALMARGIKPGEKSDRTWNVGSSQCEADSFTDQPVGVSGEPEEPVPAFLPPPLLEERPAPKPVESFLPLNTDGSVPATPPIVHSTLHKFGHQSFRDGQEAAIMRVLSGL